MSKAIEKQCKRPAWLLDRAQAVGARDYERKARLIDMPMKLLLGRTLKPKIAKRFGGRMKAMVSGGAPLNPEIGIRSEEHTSELQSLMRISYAVFCLKKKTSITQTSVQTLLTQIHTHHHTFTTPL